MSKPKLDDSKRKAALASRRARDKKARDRLEDSYVIKLIRREIPEFGRDFTAENQVLVEAKRIAVFSRRYVLGNETPEREAAHQAFVEEITRRINLKAKRKA